MYSYILSILTYQFMYASYLLYIYKKMYTTVGSSGRRCADVRYSLPTAVDLHCCTPLVRYFLYCDL